MTEIQGHAGLGCAVFESLGEVERGAHVHGDPAALGQGTAPIRSQKHGQNPKTPAGPFAAGTICNASSSTEWLPNQDPMPKQTQSIVARGMVARSAPKAPSVARTKAGKGMPYFAPARELRSRHSANSATPALFRILLQEPAAPPSVDQEDTVYGGSRDRV